MIYVKKNVGQNCIMPCTCAEIATATQDGDKYLSVTGVEFSLVSLVGIIRSVNQSATRIDYEIDDYTGPYIQIKLFLDDEDSIPEAVKVKSLDCLSYVRVNGYVRSFQGVRNIVALKVVPVVEMNEITCHILETIYARMLQVKTKTSRTDSMMHSTGGVSIPATAGGLTVLQNQVLVSVRNYSDERGVSVAQICEKLRGVPEQQIREDLDFLSAEGHVYSTIDDDHFRATEA
ncbi:unnamed protein product [Schistocephalus solidus]|uniref:Replication protein A C-terminal domain-containing protein n=1 Tax=Schistocephalus solidus TaxID=70667 RepID=A0A3P7DJU0_SCHSO|nr:unnamed protein product [Schistocephalus solidus]